MEKYIILTFCYRKPEHDDGEEWKQDKERALIT